MIRTDGIATIASPGPRIPAKDVDFRVLDDGSVWLLWAVSDDAVGWVGDHLPDDAQRFGDAYVVEARYVEPILNGIEADGLVLGRAA